MRDAVYYFPMVMPVVILSEYVAEILTELYFPVVLFIMLYKVI